jgi:hypothetical protein
MPGHLESIAAQPAHGGAAPVLAKLVRAIGAGFHHFNPRPAWRNQTLRKTFLHINARRVKNEINRRRFLEI